MEFITVFVTAESYESAARISRELVDRRLAACANVLSSNGPTDAVALPVVSFYRWQGDIEESRETAMMIKTRRELFPAVCETVRELHSYDTPCIVAWPIVEIDDDYAQWLESETRPVDGDSVYFDRTNLLK